MVHQRVDKTDIRRLRRLGSPTANMVSLPASAAGKLPPTTVTATATVAAEARSAYGRPQVSPSWAGLETIVCVWAIGD